MFRILTADDHPLFREAIKISIHNLKQECSYDIEIEEASDFHEAEVAMSSKEIDLVLLDLKMPGSNGLMGAKQLRSCFPHIGIVILSATDTPSTVASAKAVGVNGYILKSYSLGEIQASIKSVLAGHYSFPKYLLDKSEADTLERTNKISTLTSKQLLVLKLIEKGALNKQIAYELNIKETTVKTHIAEILRRLGLKNRTQAAVFAQQFNQENDENF